MEPSPTPSSVGRPRPDPEFALDPYPAVRLPAGVSPVDHQRLVVNPFLAVAGLLGLVGLALRLGQSRYWLSAPVPIILLGALPFLLQFHCLDCGRTEIYSRWWRHACPKTLSRAHRNRVGWFRWPRARTQLVIWGYILGSLALLVAIIGAGAFLVVRL